VGVDGVEDGGAIVGRAIGRVLVDVAAQHDLVDGVAQLVADACDAAVLIADRLREAGFEVLNDVVLNQVLVRYVDGPTTERLMAALEADGRVWCGATQWGGQAAMRISVSSWKTDRAAAVRAAEAITEVAAGL
jgi:glutamate/tyrosine decarboxylase-like PLP-dependent enzyme